MCHPLIYYHQTSEPVNIPAGLPFDKYELQQEDMEPFSALTSTTLGYGSRTAPCWPVYVQGSHRPHSPNDRSPFGFLRPNTSGGVTLYVLPFNYPEFFLLLGTHCTALWHASGYKEIVHPDIPAFLKCGFFIRGIPPTSKCIASMGFEIPCLLE